MTYKGYIIFVAVFSAVTVVTRLIALYALDRYPGKPATKVVLVVAASVASVPGILAALFMAPVELLLQEPNESTTIAAFVGMLALSASAEAPHRVMWNLSAAVAFGWAFAAFVTSVVAVEAACMVNAGTEVCKGFQGDPFQIGNVDYVLQTELELYATAGAVNTIAAEWTAADGDFVQGTFTCFDGTNKPDSGNTFTDSYDVSTQFVGTFTSGYVPSRTCSGHGVGFGLGVTIPLPFAPTVGATASAVTTWVTVDCPAERVQVANTPIWGLQRVLVSTLTPHLVLSDLVASNKITVCNLVTLACHPLYSSGGGFYDVYFSNNSYVGQSPTEDTVAWLSFQDPIHNTIYPEVRCTVDGFCGLTSLTASTCPGVTQVINQDDVLQPVWDYTKPYRPLNAQFMDAHIPELASRCQQTDAGLTVTGTGMQPMFYSLQQQGQNQCTPDSYEQIPATVSPNCELRSTSGPVLVCPAEPSGYYTLRALNQTQPPVLCNKTGEVHVAGCTGYVTECGTFFGCGPGANPLVPGTFNGFSNTHPQTGMCKIAPVSANGTAVVVNATGAPCKIGGAAIMTINEDGLYTWAPSVQGQLQIYGRESDITAFFNWSAGTKTDTYNWSDNVTPGKPPDYTFPDYCDWECNGEILCLSCAASSSDWCTRYQGAISYAQACHADFFFKGVEILIIRITIYSVIAILAIALIYAIWKRCMKRSRGGSYAKN